MMFSKFLPSYLLILLFNCLVNPKLRLLHKKTQVIKIIFDLFVAFNVAVRDQELDLTK